MIKRIIFGWLAFLSLSASAQVQTQLIGDSVRIHSNTGTGELILENSTRSVNGFLYNRGNGRTEFKKGLTRVTDSLYLVGGDSLRLMPGGNTSVQSLTDGSTITWNVANGTNGTVVLGGTGRTLTITNPIAGQFYRLNVKQDATGSRTITTWPSGTLWASGAAPALTSAANAIDLVTLYYDGTNYIGSYQLFNRTNSNVSILFYDAESNVGPVVNNLSGVPAGSLLVLTTAYGGGNRNAAVTSVMLIVN